MWYWRNPNNQLVISIKAANGLRSKPKPISGHKSTVTPLNQSNPCTNTHNPRQSKPLVITSKLDQSHGFKSVDVKPSKKILLHRPPISNKIDHLSGDERAQSVLLLCQWPKDHFFAGESESNLRIIAFEADKPTSSLSTRSTPSCPKVSKRNKTHG